MKTVQPMGFVDFLIYADADWGLLKTDDGWLAIHDGLELSFREISRAETDELGLSEVMDDACKSRLNRGILFTIVQESTVEAEIEYSEMGMFEEYSYAMLRDFLYKNLPSWVRYFYEV